MSPLKKADFDQIKNLWNLGHTREQIKRFSGYGESVINLVARCPRYDDYVNYNIGRRIERKTGQPAWEHRIREQARVDEILDALERDRRLTADMNRLIDGTRFAQNTDDYLKVMKKWIFIHHISILVLVYIMALSFVN